MKHLFFSIVILLSSLYTHAQTITTIAGGGNTGLGNNGPATAAELDGPIGVALDGKGNFYIADADNNRIRKVNTSGIITTIAGGDTSTYNGDGIPATAAHLSVPIGIICDPVGNIYFADAFHNRVRKIDTFGIITTIAGTGIGGYNGDNIPATAAEIYDPHCLAMDNLGNIYIADMENSRIRKIDVTGIITTIAGNGLVGNIGDNGPATNAQINNPYGIIVDNTGNIFFSDYLENVVRKIDVLGIITTFAGGGGSIGDNGPANLAKLKNPGGVAVDANNNIYIADSKNYRVRKVTAATGIITTIAGDGTLGFSGDNGPATNAKLNQPGAIAIDATGGVYISDYSNNRIRFIKNALGVNSINNYEAYIAIYPNPSDGNFTVNVTSVINGHIQVIITNATGARIKEITAFTGVPLYIQMDQPAGIYYLSVVTANGITSKMISIVK